MTDRASDGEAFGIPPLAGHPGPVLVLADNEALARRAPAWAAGFLAVGRPHRVRVVGPVAGEMVDLVAEATDLAATAILAAGGAGACRAARAVAARLGLPLVIESDGAILDK